MRFLSVAAALAAAWVLSAPAARAQAPDAAPEPTVTYSASPSLGMTFEEIDRSTDGATLNAKWLFGLDARFNVEGEGVQFGASLYAQYGQVHARNELPRKVQDDIILTLTPSVPITRFLRLFLEVSGETQMRPGEIDGSATAFLDPLFAYETLFLGRRERSASADGSSALEMTYGVGYAIQQTLTQHYVFAENRSLVVDENNPLRNVQDQTTLESGYSGVFSLNYTNRISPGASLRASVRSVALTKAPKPDNLADSRGSALVLAGLKFHFIDLAYSLRLTYDRNLSPRRQLDQSLVVGVRGDF